MHGQKSSSPIVFVAGPALGHVGRLYIIARELRRLTDRYIAFATPDNSRYADDVLGTEFDLIRIPFPVGNGSTPAEAFADGLERALSELKPGAIVTDMCPVRWLSAMRFPDCRRIMVTNFFLTGFTKDVTIQSQWLERDASKFAALRERRGLPPLQNLEDIYRADRILLADPGPLLDGAVPLPDNHILTGPCSWAPEGALPVELKPLSDLLLLSMGSTGPASFESDLPERVARWSGTSTTVYVGSKTENIRERGVAHCYSWLPLDAALAKARVAVTHGGTGSTYQALAHGVPVVIVPAHLNHKVLGEYVEKAGLGLCIKTPDDLQKFETTNFSAIMDNVRRFADRMDGIDGAALSAAQILEVADV